MKGVICRHNSLPSHSMKATNREISINHEFFPVTKKIGSMKPNHTQDQKS